jgi:hypothetical protein
MYSRNKEMYTEILCHLKDAVRLVSSAQHTPTDWQYLAKHNVETSEYPPYSLDLLPVRKSLLK